METARAVLIDSPQNLISEGKRRFGAKGGYCVVNPMRSDGRLMRD